MELDVLTPTDFIVLSNQTLEYVYPRITIRGEVRNLSISRNRWVYFDIADDYSKIKCFGSTHLLPGPLEEGLLVRIIANPRLHQQYGFSLNLQGLAFEGEGSIKKASDLLRDKLAKEGLFASERKRTIPYIPSTIGLITSEESAAYRDFVKILANRMGGIDIELADVKVQGSQSVSGIITAIEWFNRAVNTPDVIVLTRGGGSPDDLQAFNDERLVRAVASSRVPTLVAIGHETDLLLAEMASDLRASTPSNAAEVLVPDRKAMLSNLDIRISNCHKAANDLIESESGDTRELIERLTDKVNALIQADLSDIDRSIALIGGYNPDLVLKRGYAILSSSRGMVMSASDVSIGERLDVMLSDGSIGVEVKSGGLNE